jgi:hypothetical protein
MQVESFLVDLIAQNTTVGVFYPGYHGPSVATHKSWYDWLPSTTNDQEATHPIPDMTPPLLAEEGRVGGPKKN